MTIRSVLKAAAILLAALAATEARADGFAVHDLSTIAEDLNAALGDGFIHRAEAGRVTLMCTTCAGQPMLDVLIGRQTDGTEERVRSGATSIERLEAICKEREPSCRLSALDVAPAVGWISTYPIGGTAGSTVIMLRDGDMLTVRSLASDADVARGNAEKAAKAAAAKLLAQ